MVWNPWHWLFGRQLTPQQMLRKYKQILNRAVRNVDRERVGMERQEKKLISDIKKTAKEGQMDAVKIMAKDLVQTRRNIKKFMLMKANLQGVQNKIVTLGSQNAISEAMRGITLALRQMNQQLQLPRIQRILQEFEKQSMVMDMKEEMMSETIDDAMDGEDDEEEKDAIVAQIFDELGLQLTDQLSELPEAKGNPVKAISKVPVATENSLDVMDLQARLDNLRRDDSDLPRMP